MALPKRIIFVRHAIAIPAEDFAGPDSERPLTPDGIARARAVFAKVLAQERVDRIITSPYVRAVATAELVQRALSKPPALEHCAALVPDAAWSAWQTALSAWTPAFDGTECVAVVGHEPSIGAFFARHLGHGAPLPFKKAGIGILEPRGLEAAELIAFLPPKYLRARV